MTSFTWFILAGYVLALAGIVHLAALRKRPASTLAWARSILLFPSIGVLLYWAIGADRLRRKRLRRRAGFASFRRERHGAAPTAEAGLSASDAALARVCARLNGIPPTRVDSLRLLPDADGFHAVLAQRIRAAQHRVHIQFFIWRDDDAGRRLRDVLVTAARRGVKVRVLIDEIGSALLPCAHFKELVEAGGEFSWFLTINPRRHRYLFNLRNHRKVQIIDGTVALVGGMNIGVEYRDLDPEIGPWRDLQAEFTGPLACTLQESFADDWYFATEQKISEPCYYPASEDRRGSAALVLAGGPDDPSEPVQKSLLAVLNHARTGAWLSTGYFVPNGVTMAALELCAARGVDGRLLITEKTDHPGLLRIGRSFYDELLAAGVRIFEFSSAINHTKAGVIDDDWPLIGSAKINNRSMRVNFELGVLVRRREAADRFADTLARDFAASTEIIADTFARRPWREKAWEAAARPFAPLL